MFQNLINDQGKELANEAAESLKIIQLKIVPHLNLSLKEEKMGF